MSWWKWLWRREPKSEPAPKAPEQPEPLIWVWFGPCGECIVGHW